MGHDANAYARLLKALFPKGRAWRTDDQVRDELLEGKAVELARVDARVDDLLDEAILSKASELLSDHEVDFGLPDGCLDPSVMTIAERRIALLTKLQATGRINKQYYIDLAATLGYTIHIDEFTPAWAGLALAGDPCGDQPVIFYWLVNVHYDFLAPFTDYDDLQCLINKLKPVWTNPVFAIYGPGFDSGFSNGFSAMPAPAMEGGFDTGFSNGFEVRYGGGFDGEGFSDGFDKPYVHFGY